MPARVVTDSKHSGQQDLGGRAQTLQIGAVASRTQRMHRMRLMVSEGSTALPTSGCARRSSAAQLVIDPAIARRVMITT